MVKAVEFAGRTIAPGQPCFIIAEAGVNHNGDMNLAHRLIDAAVDSGADAVKFQTFKAERLAIANAPKAEYQNRTTEAAESQFDMLRRLELSPESHRDLMAACEKRGILFMSSFFDEASADLLDEMNVAVLKIPSGEITNLPLLAHAAAKGRPMILSTGMASLGEVEAAVEVIQQTTDAGLILLQCVTNYPAAPSDVNLAAMATMSAAFGVPVGYSDHTPGIEVPIAAVALGATVIEKHFTLDSALPGPDHRASSEPVEFASMVRSVRSVESAIGNGRKEPAESESGTSAAVRKSLVAAGDIPAGTVLTENLIAVKRPGTGLPPAMRPYLIGRSTRVAIPGDTLITLEMLG
jgi:N,N'-diacetyllegionaminate synthase